jgi:hypothetical protein
LRGQKLSGDAEGDVALELGAGRAQDPKPKLSGAIQGRLIQARFAYPGVPFDQQGLPIAYLSPFKRCLKRLEDGLSLEQPRGSPFEMALSVSVRKIYGRH